jgi:NAD(P)-dependent dehydrogenase (short-subunit alcohol dehydrogenase family)
MLCVLWMMMNGGGPIADWKNGTKVPQNRTIRDFMAFTETVEREQSVTNPKETYPKPPFPDKVQRYPGNEQEMEPRADHGEQSYRGHGRLAGKKALITGGDSGIGKAIAIAFAREGADVAISYLAEEEEDGQDTRRWIEEAGKAAMTLPGDIQDERHCQSMVDRVFGEFGGLDILINNAAFQMTHESMEQIPPGEFERTFRTNVFSMFYLCQAAANRMNPGGAIVNTASIQAFEPKPELLAYAATKGAIVTFTKALAKEVIKHGIRANAVAPGPVWTPLIPATMPKEEVANFGASTPLGRPAQPVEIAPLYVFLASTDSTFITGEVFGATGGKMPT